MKQAPQWSPFQLPGWVMDRVNQGSIILAIYTASPEAGAPRERVGPPPHRYGKRNTTRGIREPGREKIVGLAPKETVLAMAQRAGVAVLDG